jgi:glycosyltransferase involved in cell wall biosynthesis
MASAAHKIRIVQGTTSMGYGGLEMVIVEFHEWLLKNNHEACVLAVQGSPLERNLIRKGFQSSTISVPMNEVHRMKNYRLELDSPHTAFLFHRQQGLRALILRRWQSKISVISHTFYGVKKKDLWHRYLFSKVNQWIVLTERHKENLLETTPIPAEHVKVIPNGVDLTKFRPYFKPFPTDNQIVHIGIIGRLDPKKGQDLALQALKILISKNQRPWKLHLLGSDTPNEPPTGPHLKQLAKDLGILDAVSFDNYQDHLWESIHNLDVVWTPSHKETFGRCILESMASGVPVIASRAGGVPDIIRDGENGLMFETMNPSDLARQTELLLSSPKLFANIQNQGLQDVQKQYVQEKIWQELFETIRPDGWTAGNEKNLLAHATA